MPPTSDAAALADKSLRGEALTRGEARAVLAWPDADVLTLLHETYRVRRAHFGLKVRLNYLVNIQSGVCPEDCGYCSQSKVSKAPIAKYKLMPAAAILKAAEEAVRVKAARLCLVASGRGPDEGDVAAVGEAVRAVKARHPGLEVCACLGLLEAGQAEALRAAGVDAYNHNLNTSERRYEDICSTHTHADRVATVAKAQAGGLSACSGAIFGLGEAPDDVLDVAYRLRAMKVDSIPLNFLIPIPGTPLAGREEISALDALKVLCLFRLLCPEAELRVAGGREVNLRSLQPLALYVANSIFIGDYLTTEGQAPVRDLEMIRDLGFEVVGDVPGGPDLPARTPLDERVALLPRKKP